MSNMSGVHCVASEIHSTLTSDNSLAVQTGMVGVFL